MVFISDSSSLPYDNTPKVCEIFGEGENLAIKDEKKDRDTGQVLCYNGTILLNLRVFWILRNSEHQFL